MADRTELAFRREADALLPAGQAILAAVSGGGDSVALLHLLRRFVTQRSAPLFVAHLDHGLRRGSRADRTFVERLAARLGFECVADRREVAGLRRRAESPEEAARRVRRAFLLEAAATTGARRIALGHTLDDQAETVLMRMARGAGARALTGMAASGPGPFVRPLLRLEREDLRGYLVRKKLPFREDASNRDLRFDRNRVRRLVLPVLADALNPRAARHLVRAADTLREDALYLDALAEARYRSIARIEHDNRVVLDARRLARLPAPLGRRLSRLVLQRVGIDGRRVSARHVQALLDLAVGPRGRDAHLPGGLRAARRGDSIHVEARERAMP